MSESGLENGEGREWGVRRSLRWRVEVDACPMLSNKNLRHHPYVKLISYLYLRFWIILSLSVTKLSSLVCMHSLSLENILQSFDQCCAGPPHLTFTMLRRWTALQWQEEKFQRSVCMVCTCAAPPSPRFWQKCSVSRVLTPHGSAWTGHTAHPLCQISSGTDSI